MVFDIILTVMGVIIIGLLVYLIYTLKGAKKGNGKADKEEIKAAVTEAFGTFSGVITSGIETSNRAFVTSINEKLGDMKADIKFFGEQSGKNHIEYVEKLAGSINTLASVIREENEKSIRSLNDKFEEFSKNMVEKLELIGKGVDKSLDNIRRENGEKLGEISKIVDEKLQKTLDERLKTSFESVVTQIGNVNSAIGEIKNIATDVGSLKTILTNVKTKGIVGEVILGSIISQVLTKEQYEENFATKKGSKDVVEFAVKMPAGEDTFIYLPIDSKFPLETYYKIKDGIDKANKADVDSARKELRQKLKTYAKDISTKYIDVPNTTDFAIMFLPIEGLYIEAIEGGLFEELQREYRVNIVGPSTLAALLNALRQGFNSLAIQKKSNEVFKLLGAVRTEFEKFAKTLESAQKKVDAASDEIENLVGTRTRQITRKLKSIEGLPDDEARDAIDAE